MKNTLALLAFAGLSLHASLAGAALPAIVPIAPAAAEEELEIDQRIVLPRIAPDQFYAVRFWAEDKSKPQTPEVVQVIEMPAGANELPLLRYFAPGTRYRWAARLHRREDALSAIAEVKAGPAFVVKGIQDTPPPASTVIAIVEPARGKKPRIVDGDALIKWRPVADAATYIVATCVVDGAQVPQGRSVEECPEGKGGTVKRPKARFAGLKDGELPWAYVPMQPDKRVHFYVKALDATGSVIAYSSQEAFEVEASPFAPLKGHHLSLRGTLDKVADESKNFATIGYSRGTDKDGDFRFYRSQFALQWLGDESESALGRFAPSASLEAILNSRGKKRGDDKIVVRAGLIDQIPSLTGGPADRYSIPARASLAVKYETNRSTSLVKRTEKTLGELRLTPSFPWDVINIPAANDYTGRYPAGLFQARITPTLGVDRGRTEVVGASEETSRNVLRYVGQLRVEVSWAGIATPAGAVSLFGERTWYHLPWETLRSPAYVTSGIDVPLAPDTAFSIRYNVGRTAPLFLPARSFDVGIGIKF